MLQALRDKTSGWIAVAIVILLAVPFAFFGMEQYLFQNSANYAAKVQAPPAWWPSAPDAWPVRKLFWTSEEVSPEAFRSEFERSRQQAREQQGEAFDGREFEAMDNKLRVLDSLVDQAVLRLAARNAGIEVGNAQVAEVIQSIPDFQVDGRFDPQRYQLVLQSRVPSRTPREYDDQIRADLQMLMLPRQVAGSAFITKAQLDRTMVLLGEQRDVSFAVVPAPQPDTGAISAADIQGWYASHRGDFRAAESVSIEYVEVEGSKLPPPAAPDEATLRARYEQEKARFVEPEQRLASHILVRVPEGADAAAQAAAKARAEAIAAKVQAAGADFAAVARAESDDEGSKAQGGDLGWIERNTMGDAFDTALYALQPGQVSAPVQTDFGWHVLQLREVSAGKSVPFEAARDELAAAQSATDGERAFNDLIGRLVDQVYRNPGSLAPTAREAKLPVQKLGPFTRGDAQGIAAHPAVLRAAFSDALVQDGTVSDPIEIGPSHSVLIRVTAHQPERELPLADVRDQVVAAIRADRGRAAAIARADADVARIAGGESLAAIAAAAGWQYASVPGARRGMPVPSAEANDAYFAAAGPVEGKPSVGKLVQDDGSIVLFTVDKVTPGNPQDASPQERAMLASQFAQMAGQEDAETMLRALRRRMNISIVEARL
ncbi:peptidyl-prolyl cis-trans isomerase [Luteimonas sp. MC1825]|uniref:peptidyl-prolyl cis-trans isomerase n=1 Tax=Luteimonas sp. MC1825 TaxID=2761107 RepID=UPI001612BEDC|nr:peptidyl-prolyl cis-trans isomerase [Luteimonas sp. MC1825]MBB6599778.1 SurA N-terminal domain-containing protein [Luteimonas sp. MC1825]QOC87453.1 SurA N-terminal domain-containing protein [Luteimonas sp. MC1825]